MKANNSTGPRVPAMVAMAAAFSLPAIGAGKTAPPALKAHIFSMVEDAQK